MTIGSALKRPLRSVVIVGGGTAGWMAAAAASRFLDDGQRTIQLVESDAIGTVGVGEATIPPIVGFNRQLGIDEDAFLRETGATFKLGIEFDGWRIPGERYFHPFGSPGRDFEGVAFHQFWLKHRHRPGAIPFDRYFMSAAAARAGRFDQPVADARHPASQLAYAYHFDAALYAGFLRRRAEAGGVRRTEGRIVAVERDDVTGFVTALRLDDGRRIEGELFIDCSGFRSLLLGETLGVGFVDWSRWLPCDRAIAMPSAAASPLPAHTVATADAAGWRWRIPLQHRTGNGIVYASAEMSDDRAEQLLRTAVSEPASTASRPIHFTPGVRERLWEGNVVALGLAGGFLEPLESTSIHLIQSGISKLFWLFPDSGFSAVERDEYNRLMREQYDGIRDFIILHYHANQRPEPFWQATRETPPPDSLAHKLALFREKGRVLRYDQELFGVPNWAAVLLGQGVIPDGYDPLVDATDDDRIVEAMDRLARGYVAAAAAMPAHADHIAGRISRPAGR